MLTGSEDSLLRVLDNSDQLTVKQTFSDHQASVRTISKVKIPQTITGLGASHLVLSAGSKM